MSIPTAIWEGEIDVCGIKLKCFVLDDGRRIIESGSIAELISGLERPDISLSETEAMALGKFLNGTGIPE